MTQQIPASFEEMDLSGEILKAVRAMGFTEPFTVQRKTIPLMMEGADINAIAPTGTGKTCAFGIPMLEYMYPDDPSVQELVLAQADCYLCYKAGQHWWHRLSSQLQKHRT